MAAPRRSPLRAKLADTTRDAIVDAFVAMLTEDGGFDVNYAELARRAAGVDPDPVPPLPDPRRAARCADPPASGSRWRCASCRTTARACSPRSARCSRGSIAHAALFTAQIHTGTRSRIRARGRSRRASAFEEVLAKATPHLRAERRRAAAGILHLPGVGEHVAPAARRARPRRRAVRRDHRVGGGHAVARARSRGRARSPRPLEQAVAAELVDERRARHAERLRGVRLVAAGGAQRGGEPAALDARPSPRRAACDRLVVRSSSSRAAPGDRGARDRRR